MQFSQDLLDTKCHTIAADHSFYFKTKCHSIFLIFYSSNTQFRSNSFKMLHRTLNHRSTYKILLCRLENHILEHKEHYTDTSPIFFKE